MIRSPLACPSLSDGHDVLCLSVGLSRILLFVSVTELLPLAKFSRHAKAQTSLTLVIWLNENILIPTSSSIPFPNEASSLTFTVAKFFYERSGNAERAQTVFCKHQVPYSSDFFKNFLPYAPSNKNFSWPKGEIIR